MRIVVDRNIPYAVEAFHNVGEVTAVPTPQVSNAIARQAEVLIVRNETRVDETLLRDTPVRFVASATAGADHVSLSYLVARGIAFANAPGCNANSVKEYFLAALLSYAVRKGVSLRGKTLGVVGVGAIGSRVAKVAEALGMSVLQNDPPLARATGDPKFVPLAEVLTADFVTLHAPLTTRGPDATYHLVDEKELAHMKPTSVLINTARGAVVDSAALKRALHRRKIADALIDVWEGEPAIDHELASGVALATAHMAGFSVEGKLAAVRIVREAVCRFFGVTSEWNTVPYLPPVQNAQITVTPRPVSDEAALHEIVRHVYDVEHDHQRLRDVLTIPAAHRAAGFMLLRIADPARREASAYKVNLCPEREHLRQTLSALGFVCSAAQKIPLHEK